MRNINHSKRTGRSKGNRANINDFKRGQKIGQTIRGHLKRTREVTKSRAR